MLLFAYGTLMYGLPAHRLLVGSLFAGRGCTRGELYLCEGYPLLVAEGEGCVWGELYHVEEHVAMRIDWYEGASSPTSPWRRMSVDVDVLGVRVHAVAYGVGSRSRASKLCEHLEGPLPHGDYGLVARRGPPRWLVVVPFGAEQPPGLTLGSMSVQVQDATLEERCLANAPGSRIEAAALDLLAEREALEEWAEGLGCKLHGVEAKLEGYPVYPVAPLGARG